MVLCRLPRLSSFIFTSTDLIIFLQCGITVLILNLLPKICFMSTLTTLCSSSFKYFSGELTYETDVSRNLFSHTYFYLYFGDGYTYKYQYSLKIHHILLLFVSSLRGQNPYLIHNYLPWLSFECKYLSKLSQISSSLK